MHSLYASFGSMPLMNLVFVHVHVLSQVLALLKAQKKAVIVQCERRLSQLSGGTTYKDHFVLMPGAPRAFTHVLIPP